MSTRSFIGIKEPDGKVRGIYCHYDGYPEGVGRTLTENYTDPTKTFNLLGLGDISSLGETLRSTEAYARDRGEAKAAPIWFDSLDDVKATAADRMGVEYAYVYECSAEGGGWGIYKLSNY